MAKPDNQWQVEAREMAERIERQRAQGEQLALLPDEEPEQDQEQRQAGRPKGSRNKVSSQMRDWLAARGMRMPEDVLVQIAGLNSRDDAITLAMAQTERVLAWAYDGAHIGKKSAPAPTAVMRLEVFRQQYTMILRASEAMMPFTAPKVTPDVSVQQNTVFMMPAVPSAPVDPGAQARDVTPRMASRMMPADVAHEMQENQKVSSVRSETSDAEIRTDLENEGKSDG